MSEDDKHVASAAGKTDIAIGQRYGKLEVVECVGIKNTSPSQINLMWLCRCDCGNTIELPRRKLRNKKECLNFTACDECSKKTCVLCGERFSRRRRFPFCESPACAEMVKKAQQERRNEGKRRRYANDPAFREHNKEAAVKWRETHPGYHWEHVQSTPQRYEVFKERLRKTATKRREQAKTDDVLREKLREQQQRYLTKKALSGFVADAQKIIEKMDKNE